METIEGIKVKIRKEKQKMEELAFEIYCTRELSHQMDIVEKVENDLENKSKRLESLTIEKLKEDFNSYNINLLCTNKEKIIKELNDNKEICK